MGSHASGEARGRSVLTWFHLPAPGGRGRQCCVLWDHHRGHINHQHQHLSLQHLWASEGQIQFGHLCSGAPPLWPFDDQLRRWSSGCPRPQDVQETEVSPTHCTALHCAVTPAMPPGAQALSGGWGHHLSGAQGQWT